MQAETNYFKSFQTYVFAPFLYFMHVGEKYILSFKATGKCNKYLERLLVSRFSTILNNFFYSNCLKKFALLFAELCTRKKKIEKSWENFTLYRGIFYLHIRFKKYIESFTMMIVKHHFFSFCYSRSWIINRTAAVW